MTVFLLVGHIASGKSSYAFEKAKEGSIIVNDDAIVNAVHGGHYDLYDKKLKPLYKSIENIMVHTAIAMQRDVVIDRGLDVSINSRQRWIAIARSLDVPINVVVFEVFPPEVHAKRRFKSDSRGHDYDYWLRVATFHAARYQLPTMEEGFTEIISRKWIDT